MPNNLTLEEARDLNDPELLRQVNLLRKTDNVTNWYYLAREYLFLAAVIGATIGSYYFLLDRGLSLLWSLPVTLVCIVCVGAGQHRLATLTHEAAHYMLFRNRLLNELVSEWFCMFPILGTTHSYRVQHLGHHQYPNDPDRDPDWTQMRLSGHRYQVSHDARPFPVGMRPQAAALAAEPDSLRAGAGQLQSGQGRQHPVSHETPAKRGICPWCGSATSGRARGALATCALVGAMAAPGGRARGLVARRDGLRCALAPEDLVRGLRDQERHPDALERVSAADVQYAGRRGASPGPRS